MDSFKSSTPEVDALCYDYDDLYRIEKIEEHLPLETMNDVHSRKILSSKTDAYQIVKHEMDATEGDEYINVNDPKVEKHQIQTKIEQEIQSQFIMPVLDNTQNIKYSTANLNGNIYQCTYHW